MNSNKFIVLMLDIQGTLNGMNDELADIFIHLVDIIRVSYNAKDAILFISTHDEDANNIERYLNILNRHLLNNIKIGRSFYLDGHYDYDTKQIKYCSSGYNNCKTKLLEDCYIFPDIRKLAWIGIADDYIDIDFAKKYQKEKPISLFRPSKRGTNVLEEDNIMCYSTHTLGFLGVIETMSKMTENLQILGSKGMYEKQKNSLFRLDGTTRFFLLVNQDYPMLLRYMQECNLDSDDYFNIADMLSYNFDAYPHDDEELKLMQKIAKICIDSEMIKEETKKQLLKFNK